MGNSTLTDATLDNATENSSLKGKTNKYLIYIFS
jgi:hypothetical protein